MTSNDTSNKPPDFWRMMRLAWNERQAARLTRAPEPSVIMDDPEQVKAFHRAGRGQGSMQPIYYFNALRLSQMTPPGGFVVDFGSGSGQFLRYFAEMRPDIRILGFDLSDEMIEVGNQMLQATNLSSRVKIVKGDMTTFTAPENERVHVVSSIFSLHHLPSIKDVHLCLARMARIREEQGAGVWIFDCARPRHPQTPLEYPELVMKDAPKVLLDDFENTLIASWSFQELIEATDSSHMGMFSHEKVVLLMGLYQTHYLLPKGGHVRPSQHSLRLDLQIAEIHAQSSLEQITVSTWGRGWSLIKMLGRILWAVVNAGFIGLWQRTGNSKAVQRVIGQIVTRELGKLKGPLMKLGQITGQSAPKLSEEVRQNLRTLVDRSATIACKTIRKVVERELKHPIDEIFEEWSDSAFASGVMAQTHYAVLKGGCPVIVKVRYPGLINAVKSDLSILRRMRPFIKSVLGVSNIDKIYAEVHTLILAECDFLHEARNQMTFHRIFADDPEIIIPKIHPELCTPEVLVMDYIDGKPFRNFIQENTQEEKNHAGSIIWRFAASSLHKYCIFNADPHPGNFIFLDGKVAFLDFGFVKRWPLEFVEQAKRQTSALCENDLEKFSSAMRQLGFVFDDSQFDYPGLLQSYRNTTGRPFCKDEPFQFTNDFIYHQLNEVVTSQKRAGAIPLPEEFVAYIRLFWGLFSVLAQLNAEANWQKIILPILKEPSYPPPPLDEMFSEKGVLKKSPNIEKHEP
jgi:predicted unusual protein kinase regulating ubiquinone biosynthesis (AarF/ABC1/UbiB family)/ubiquinone/menaquinone biosynthesis C-methylase UbiE